MFWFLLWWFRTTIRACCVNFYIFEQVLFFVLHAFYDVLCAPLQSALFKKQCIFVKHGKQNYSSSTVRNYLQLLASYSLLACCLVQKTEGSVRVRLVLLFQPTSAVKKLNPNQRDIFRSRFHKSSLLFAVLFAKQVYPCFRCFGFQLC